MSYNEEMELTTIELEIDDETWAVLEKVAKWSLCEPADVLRVILALEAHRMGCLDEVKLEDPNDGRDGRVQHKANPRQGRAKSPARPAKAGKRVIKKGKSPSKTRSKKP